MSTEVVLSDHIFELRFKPRSDIVDRRGVIAEQLAEKLSYPDWKIDDNRVEVLDLANSRSAFISHRNCGFQLRDSPNQGFFADHAVKVLKAVLEVLAVRDPLVVPRIGARSRFAEPFAGTFEELLARFIDRYAQPTSDIDAALGGKLLDLAFSFNRADSVGNFNTLSGPMRAPEVLARLERTGTAPAVSVYFEIDYWLKPTKPISPTDLTSRLRELAISGWTKFDQVKSVLLGDLRQ